MSAGHAIDALLWLHPSLIMAEDSCVFSPPSLHHTTSLRRADGGEEGCIYSALPPNHTPLHPVILSCNLHPPQQQTQHPPPERIPALGPAQMAVACSAPARCRYLALDLLRGWTRTQ